VKAKILLKELINKHPEFDWTSFDGEGFFNLMLAYRNAPTSDQTTQQLAYDAVRAFIYQIKDKEEKELLKLLVPREISFKKKELLNGMIAFSKEAQILVKRKKTKTEKAYLELANELKADIPTVFLIWQFVNGYNKSREEILNWATNQASKAQGYNKSYYNWLVELVTNMSDQTLKKFILVKPTQVVEAKEVIDTDNNIL
jgi:hypothetical protein